MPRLNTVSIKMPGDRIGEVVANLSRAFGCAQGESERIRAEAKAIFNDRFYADLQRHIYPAVLMRLPIRTGRLKRSYKLIRKGDRAIFRAVFYGQQNVIRSSGRRVTLRTAIVEEFIKQAGPIIETSLQSALNVAR